MDVTWCRSSCCDKASKETTKCRETHCCSPSWGDLKPAPLRRAMEVTDLDHRSSCSPIDPVQVSMFNVGVCF
ncbi:hypothetical protein Peur_065005 [Populus x canadensis]